MNEYSARYSILEHEFYVPDRPYLDSRRLERHVERLIESQAASAEPDLFGLRDLADTLPPPPPRHELAPQSSSNRQGREGEIPEAEAEEILREIKAEGNRAYTIYSKLLNETLAGEILDESRTGLARELARMVLPANYYTQWYWKIDLHNLLHFLSLRADPHAQYEIRAYADVMLETVKRWVPLTHQAFTDYVLGGANLSAKGLDVVKRLMAGESVERADSGLAPREWRELMATLGRDS